MAAIYSNGNRWNILGFNFTKRDALSVYKISMVYTVPDEFGTGLKFVRFGLPFTREPRNRTNLRPPNRTNSRVNRRKRTNFRPASNSSDTACKRDHLNSHSRFTAA